MYLFYLCPAQCTGAIFGELPFGGTATVLSFDRFRYCGRRVLDCAGKTQHWSSEQLELAVDAVAVRCQLIGVAVVTLAGAHLRERLVDGSVPGRPGARERT